MKVRMPVRIRVEVAADRVDDGLVTYVCDAVDAAVSRAVSRAQRVPMIATARPSGEDSRITVRFTGDPLPKGIADALETSLCTGLYVAGERLIRRVGGPPAADEVIDTAEQSEPRDDDRVYVDDGGNAEYRVPYYNRGGKPIAVRMQGRAGQKATAPPPPPPRLRLRYFATDDDLWNAILRRTGDRPPAKMLVLRADQGGNAWGDFIDLVREGDGQYHPRRIDQGPLNIYDFPGGTRGAVEKRIHGVVDADKWSVYGRATGHAQVRELIVDMVSTMFMETSPGPAEDVRKRAGYVADELPYKDAGSLTIYQLTSRGHLVWIGPTTGPGTLPDDPRTVLVFTEDDPEIREDTYGKNCPPLDASEPLLWLSLIGLTHESPSAPEMAFLGEPAIANLPTGLSARMDQKVRAIASMTHMAPGAFVGGFLIAALAHIDRSCRILTSNRAPMWPQIQAMCAAFKPIKELFREYVTIILSLDDSKSLPCPIAGKGPEWALRFAGVYESANDDAVASLFVSTCQDILLQTLFASGHELSNRAQNLSTYMPVTRMLLTVMLADTVELMDLRDAVIERERRDQAVFMAGGMAGTAWLRVTENLLESAGEPVSREPAAKTVVRHRDGFRVYDGKGRWWSRPELEALIGAQRQQATAVDPLLDKVSEVDDVVRLLKAAQILDADQSTVLGHALTSHVDDVFRNLLADLVKENRRWLIKAATDRKLAFGLANFSRDDDYGNDIGAKLSGIHKLADARLRAAFSDQESYVSGISRLAAEEIGKAELTEILSLVGLTVLAIFCPPLAFAVGVVQAAEGLYTAFEHRDLQRAMLNADEILSKAQVEAEMWAAVINMALTVLPEVPSLVKGAGSATRAVVRGEATEAAAAATRQAMRNIAAHLAELSVEHFSKRFVTELTKAYLINLALSKAMNRIAEAVARQVGVTGHASFGDVFQVLDSAIKGAPEGTP